MIIEGVVLICDGRPDEIGETVLLEGITWKTQTPVTMPVSDPVNPSLVGTARLIADVDAREMRAIIHLPGHGHKDGKLSTLMSMMVPKVSGVIKSRAHNQIEQLDICSISLCGAPNADRRIKSLGHWKTSESSIALAARQKLIQDQCQHEPVQMIFSSYCKKCNKTL